MSRILKIPVILLSLFFFSCKTEPVPEPEPPGPDLSGLNLGFEVRHPSDPSWPANWGLGKNGYTIVLDNNEKHSGQLSLKMEWLGNPNNAFGICTNSLPIEPYLGKVVEIKAWIKTKGVENGYAGLWCGAYGENNKILGYDYMYSRRLIGDNDWTQVSARVEVSKEARSIRFGGEFNGTGTVWFDDFEIVSSEPKTSLSQAEMAALKRYVYPLRTCEPDGGDTKDLIILDQLIGSSKVVALGENSHGSSEIFNMKNRLIQYLAENHDFDIFSIEGAMPEAYRLNDYTVLGEGDPRNLIAGMYFWTWRTEEMLNMVEWMRRHNDPTPRIYYTGFDMQSYTGAVDELSNAFKGVIEVETLIGDLKKMLSDKAGINAIDPLLLLLQDRIEISSFEPSQKAWLLQNIVIIRQCLTPTYTGSRDKFMAENFIWITEQNTDSKFIIWAHNFHIMKVDDVMGSHLAQKLGGDYKAFGFTFFEGSYTAYGSRGVTSYEALTAYPGTLEYFLNQLNEPLFILDLKKIKSDNHQDLQWLMENLRCREIGSLGDIRTYEFIYRKIVDDFDYLIFIKRSSPSAVFEISSD
ncbi:MAG: erythromycin esterase family protein [Bacteroidales bacterium]|nr:erythromycin esterase family protein [Bacteroidales bacterium]